jgi:hypothetical protein
MVASSLEKGVVVLGGITHLKTNGRPFLDIGKLILFLPERYVEIWELLTQYDEEARIFCLPFITFSCSLFQSLFSLHPTNRSAVSG